ncbi:UNVERIFIED_CONTAM: hypothetical protein Sangu_0122300 [Sesamum angustifolium]|uniref:Uncharacterized protein n=1 Tax=Sesamum angustifolium TaxID=2727405 RepID=A0AAW2RJR0_9LAMI
MTWTSEDVLTGSQEQSCQLILRVLAPESHMIWDVHPLPKVLFDKLSASSFPLIFCSLYFCGRLKITQTSTIAVISKRTTMDIQLGHHVCRLQAQSSREIANDFRHRTHYGALSNLGAEILTICSARNGSPAEVDLCRETAGGCKDLAALLQLLNILKESLHLVIDKDMLLLIRAHLFQVLFAGVSCVSSFI